MISNREGGGKGTERGEFSPGANKIIYICFPIAAYYVVLGSDERRR